jgi:hypothetical protein
MAENDPQPNERPRPQFGELAPPGWVWHPPADADRLDTARKPEPEEEQPEPSTAPVFGPAGPRPQAQAGAATGTPTWNLTLTVLLGVFGFFGMSYSIATLQAIPASMQLLHSTNGLGEYTPAPIVGTLVLVGSILMAAVWVVSAAVSAWLLIKRRLSFWVPLVAGVVAMVALLIFAGAVLATDPVLLGFYSGVTPTPVQTP